MILGEMKEGKKSKQNRRYQSQNEKKREKRGFQFSSHDKNCEIGESADATAKLLYLLSKSPFNMADRKLGMIWHGVICFID